MVNHMEASQRNLKLMKEVRSEQANTAELTRGKNKHIHSHIDYELSDTVDTLSLLKCLPVCQDIPVL